LNGTKKSVKKPGFVQKPVSWNDRTDKRGLPKKVTPFQFNPIIIVCKRPVVLALANEKSEENIRNVPQSVIKVTIHPR
jgi:hypothetical protein